MLRLSATAGATAAAAPLLVGRANASSAAARTRLAGFRGRLPADAAADRIVASVRQARFPDRFFPVTRFGAVGDGVTDCTAAFTGAIQLLSNVDLHLEEGATILFSQDPAAYLPVGSPAGRASS
jgi:polygalacturonase